MPMWRPIFQRTIRSIKVRAGDGKVCHGAAFRVPDQQETLVIYKHIIYRDMIDNQVAPVLPGILKANRIQVKDAAMKYVIVPTRSWTGEDAYPLQNQTAYAAVVLEDSADHVPGYLGNRYMDVEYTKEPVPMRRNWKKML